MYLTVWQGNIIGVAWVPYGAGVRIALDRDLDLVLNSDEGW